MKAFLVTDGMVCQQNDKTYEISIIDNLSYDHCYNIHNGIVAYVYNNNVYVFPFDSNAVSELISNGFRQANMFVPFSSGDIPLENKDEYCRIFQK